MRLPRGAAIIFVGFRIGDALTGPRTRTAARQALPMEQQRRLHAAGELAALGARGVGVEDEAALIEPLQEHHAHIRQAGGVDRASAMALGSFGSVRPASSSRRRTGGTARQAAVKSASSCRESLPLTRSRNIRRHLGHGVGSGVFCVSKFGSRV